MPYYYHYTTKGGFDGTKNNHHASGTRGSDFPGDEEETEWTPRAEQPQKSSWYSEQHDKGFYLTTVSPVELTNKDSAKLGVNLTVDDKLFVFVFRSREVAGKNGGSFIGDYRIQAYKNTKKFFLTNKNSETDDKLHIRQGAVWCGPALKCPAQYGGIEP